MKVMTVDNIITTKNIRITDVGTVHSDMADHDMLWADLEFLDEAEGEPAMDNRALGQEVTASSTAEDSHPYMLNDYDMDTCWTAAEGGDQSVVLELDRVYDGKTAEIYWGDGKPESCTAAVSTDGANYAEAAVTEEDDRGGSRAAVITKSGKDAAGDGVIRQTISVEPNKRYQLSFWHKTDTLDSASFTYEINQKDEEGNTISTHLASLNDNLNMSQEYREFDYNFTTSPYAASADIVLHVVAGEGSLYLDDVTVRQVIPTEVVFVEAEITELAVGGTTKAAAQIFPENANDLTFHWASSDESVLTVAEDGTVTAVGPGSAYVQYVNSGDLTAESSVLITVK